MTPTCHKRYDRVFLYYPPDSSKQVKEHIRRARLHLNQICLKTLHKDVDGLTTQEITARSALIIQICSDDPRCKKLLSLFLFDETLPSNVDEALAHVFLVLSGDAPVSAFVPPRFHAKCIAVCNTIKKGNTRLHVIDPTAHWSYDPYWSYSPLVLRPIGPTTFFLNTYCYIYM